MSKAEMNMVPESKIFGLLVKQGEKTLDEISEYLGMCQEDVCGYLALLQNLGVIGLDDITYYIKRPSTARQIHFLLRDRLYDDEIIERVKNFADKDSIRNHISIIKPIVLAELEEQINIYDKEMVFNTNISSDLPTKETADYINQQKTFTIQELANEVDQQITRESNELTDEEIAGRIHIILSEFGSLRYRDILSQFDDPKPNKDRFIKVLLGMNLSCHYDGNEFIGYSLPPQPSEGFTELNYTEVERMLVKLHVACLTKDFSKIIPILEKSNQIIQAYGLLSPK